MINSSTNALGIIFPNSYDNMVPDLVNVRLMASIPFASRYRMVDFILSSMVNCGVNNVSVIVRNNYHSLMDHLGSGREWDLVRKHGGLHIFPPFSEKKSSLYKERVASLASILDFLRSQREKYVVMSDANIALNFDFNALLKRHIETGADVTIAYAKEELPESVFKSDANDKGFYYTMNIEEDGRVSKMYVNPRRKGLQNFSLNIFAIERELLIDMINTAYVRGQVYFERDVLLPRLDEMNVQSYCFDGYVARITDIKSYFDENMKLLDGKNLDGLFSAAPVYTKIRDDNPTRYLKGAVVKNVMAADGCVIEGEVENSILFRGVKVAKGAKVKNCILMQDTQIDEGACVEYLITDKDVHFTAGKTMRGTDSYPGYVSKGHTV